MFERINNIIVMSFHLKVDLTKSIKKNLIEIAYFSQLKI